LVVRLGKAVLDTGIDGAFWRWSIEGIDD